MEAIVLGILRPLIRGGGPLARWSGMHERTRIIHFIGALVAGGAERTAQDLVRAMKEAGAPVELACLVSKRDEAGRQWAATLEAAGVPIHVGPTRGMTPKSVLWLRNLLAQPDIRVAHIHLDYVEVAYYFARFLHRRKYAVIRKIHNTKLPSRRLFRWVLDHSDTQVYYSCGEEAHKAFMGHVRGEQVLIPNGMTFDWPRNEVHLRDERLKALGVDPAKRHFFHCGRFMGESPETCQKAQDVLVRAWRAGKIGEKGGRLHLMGDGNLFEKIKAMAQGDDSITFHGVVSNIKEWMSAADCFVLPSRWEGLPLSGVEAVGTGIPCIFSDIVSNRELDCEVAIYCPPEDEAALAACLEERLGERIEATPEAVQKQRERWGVDRTVRDFFEIYDRLMPLPSREHAEGEPACSS